MTSFGLRTTKCTLLCLASPPSPPLSPSRFLSLQCSPRELQVWHTHTYISVLSIWTPAGCGLALSRFSQSFISTSGLHGLPPPRIDLPLIYMEVGAAQTIPPTRPPHLRTLSESIKMQFSTLEAFIVLLPSVWTDGVGTPSSTRLLFGYLSCTIARLPYKCTIQTTNRGNGRVAKGARVALASNR